MLRSRHDNHWRGWRGDKGPTVEIECGDEQQQTWEEPYERHPFRRNWNQIPGIGPQEIACQVESGCNQGFMNVPEIQLNASNIRYQLDFPNNQRPQTVETKNGLRESVCDS